MENFLKVFDDLWKNGAISYDENDEHIDDILALVNAFAEVVGEPSWELAEVERAVILILDIFNFLSPSAKERFGAYLFLPSKPKDWENYIERKRKQFLKDLAQEREENIEEISKRVEMQARVNHENFKRLRNGEKITVFSVFAFFGL